MKDENWTRQLIELLLKKTKKKEKSDLGFQGRETMKSVKDVLQDESYSNYLLNKWRMNDEKS